ncbi:MAG: winged helix-turn-helix domain-containing protein [Nitrososphaerales archaeon]
MTNQRRSRLDVIAAILEAALYGEKKTRIVYHANLNFKLIKKLLPILINKGLIEQAGNGYKTTEKGKAYLKHYKEIKELF